MTQTNNLDEVRNQYMHLGAQQGWQCPVCGNVLSPWTTMCPCHGQPNYGTVTTTSIDATKDTIDKLNQQGVETIEFNTYYKTEEE